MKEMILRFLPVIDFLLLPFVYPSAWLLKNVRSIGVERLPKCKNALMKIGVFPIRNQYYEPQFDHRSPKQPFSCDRLLPAIDWNITEQIRMLSTFSFSQELSNIPLHKPDTLDFYINNGAFESGDAEYWYQLIRSIKPKRLFEVGSGKSTLMAIKAICKNRESEPNHKCKHRVE